MNEKELYKQKKQAKLDEWEAEVDKLKAKASGVSADVQLKLNKQIKELEGKVEQGKAKLADSRRREEEKKALYYIGRWTLCCHGSVHLVHGILDG